MAQRTEIILTDDLDGGPADETVSFGFEGKAYEIDLSKANAANFRANFGPYIGAARTAGRVGRTAGPSRTRSTTERETSAEIRAWAKTQGISVNDRGRIPHGLAEQWEAAGSPVGNAAQAPPAPSIPFTAPPAPPAADGAGEAPKRGGGRRSAAPSAGKTRAPGTATARRGGGRRTTA